MFIFIINRGEKKMNERKFDETKGSENLYIFRYMEQTKDIKRWAAVAGRAKQHGHYAM